MPHTASDETYVKAAIMNAIQVGAWKLHDGRPFTTNGDISLYETIWSLFQSHFSIPLTDQHPYAPQTMAQQQPSKVLNEINDLLEKELSA